ncbi:hypothetical protein CYMTET_33201 [Cymbomonas tetramitiformis]|uniref:Trafficking protein particle complex subunit 2-like protein n=1 Tax=Cymbomonas tetramitiformis TaxID=36881 RepID=A0AAE0FDD7_9CHLO|nr:hypothetical protein CYMTET_33201 [Cymbomonas tetramitiformis]
MIVCAAVVGPSYNPLHLQTFALDDDPLKYHYIVHCALDVIDERLSPPSPRSRGAGGNDPCLGYLYSTEDFKVYGYVSNTHVKFLLVLDDPETKDVRELFHRFHSAYIDAVSNPFQLPGHSITSRSFEARLRALASS